MNLVVYVLVLQSRKRTRKIASLLVARGLLFYAPLTSRRMLSMKPLQNLSNHWNRFWSLFPTNTLRGPYCKLYHRHLGNTSQSLFFKHCRMCAQRRSHSQTDKTRANCETSQSLCESACAIFPSRRLCQPRLPCASNTSEPHLQRQSI